MSNQLQLEDQLLNNNDLVQISKNELRSLYRRIIECEKIIEEYKNKEDITRPNNQKQNIIE